jgi:AraC-like DNA-binding protein
MPFVTHTPCAPLSRFVDYLWWLSDTPAHQQERIVPTGTQELVINLDADAFDIHGADSAGASRRFAGAMVSGAYSKYFVIDTRAHASLLGVHFKPGGAGPLLGVPPGELADEHVDLAVLWGSQARDLRERVGATATTDERFRQLEAALLERLRRSSQPHPATALAIDRLVVKRHNVGEISSELGVSRRRLIELFTADVGMTPKLYGRVQRFQWALTHARGPALDWAALAQRAGYCDQSHLIRDFVAFSGFSPTELLRHTGARLKEHHLGHVP